jgi:hypothetical protein
VNLYCSNNLPGSGSYNAFNSIFRSIPILFKSFWYRAFVRHQAAKVSAKQVPFSRYKYARARHGFTWLLLDCTLVSRLQAKWPAFNQVAMLIRRSRHSGTALRNFAFGECACCHKTTVLLHFRHVFFFWFSGKFGLKRAPPILSSVNYVPLPATIYALKPLTIIGSSGAKSSISFRQNSVPYEVIWRVPTMLMIRLFF